MLERWLPCVLVAVTALGAGPASAQTGVGGLDRDYVVNEPAQDHFPLAREGQPAPLYVSPDDHEGVILAVIDLRSDLQRVTGTTPELLQTDRIDRPVAVLVGTLGRSPLIDDLVSDGSLDVSGLTDCRECFVTQEVALRGAEGGRALVVAGSDKRGTIYGVYDLSSQIGVSPWYWWADVAVPHREELHVLPGRHTRGEPAVQYRGIFLNDEAPALSGWADETFGGFNHEFYEHVFELILRLGGNFLWPAMWDDAFYDDDPLNAELADEYGVVIGTSHHEPMARAHAEWARYGSGPWDYAENDSTLRAFWREGVQRMGSYETLVTMGMRGDGDMPMSREADIALLERIVADQRVILGDVTGRAPETVPQVWALYKEVQEYYDRGMRVPDDVTLLFADDNWGNIRRLPDIGAVERAGGYGVYYHFDYVGGPRNYKWINTNPIARVWEQMNLAYQLGVDRIWVVNVGDIKPMEFPIQFFLNQAWAPDSITADRLAAYTEAWAAQQFGADHAGEIADIVTTTLKFADRRKPELLTPDTYSLTNYREADRVVEEYDALERRARRVGNLLSAEHHASYYQLVLHPVEAAANLHRLYVTVARNRLHAQQGRATTNELARRAEDLYARDAEITAFYNDTLAGGKWRHMMDQTHIGYTYWQQPPENSMPEVEEIEVPAAADMGVAIEGSDRWWPDESAEAALPEIDRYSQQTRFVEVFNRGRTPFSYTVTAEEPWVRVSPEEGRVESEARLSVGVDWSGAPVGRSRVPISITGPGGRSVEVTAVVHNPSTPAPEDVDGFVASDGYVSMEAERYSRAVGGDGIGWVRVPDIGRRLSGITASPVTAASVVPGGDSPHLEYRVHVFEPVDAEVRAYLSPTLDYNAPVGLRFAVSFDDEEPRIVDAQADASDRAWSRAVSDNARVAVSQHRLESAGAHTLKVWFVDPGVVLENIVLDLGGLKPSYLGPPESYLGGAH